MRSEAELRQLVNLIANVGMPPEMAAQSVSQRACTGAEILHVYLSAEIKRQRFTQGIGRPGSKDERCGDRIAAKIVGVGSSSVQRCLGVLKREPAVFEQIRSGRIAVTAAWEMVVEKRAPKPVVVPSKSWAGTPDSRRQAAARERMVAGLSRMRGLSRGLSEIDTNVLLSTLTEEEKQEWSHQTERIIYKLRDFAAALRGRVLKPTAEQRTA